VWLAGALLLAPWAGAVPPAVSLERTPGGGIQPQAAVDETGTLHLVYYQGKPEGGDVYYVRRSRGQPFGKPLRVNGRPGSAVAIGSVRGAHLAVGRGGRAHVAWMGGQGAAPALVQGRRETAMLYTRLDDQGAAFEPERNLLTWAAGLDGGGSVAADPRGGVYVAWHASAPGNQAGEAGRAVFVASSNDEGRTFARETQASRQPTGVCGCCGMRAFADSQGRLFLLYRAASNEVERGMSLLAAPTRGEPFQLLGLSQWRLSTCPMSSATMTEAGGSVLAAWESQDQVWFCTVARNPLRVGATVHPVGDAPRKHPSIARNRAGETLLAWTEGTGWEKGGAVVWQCFDQAGSPLGQAERREGVPVWSLASAVALPEGGFIIFY
jgi:hypothetical protein